jgi:hypothetical protein
LTSNDTVFIKMNDTSAVVVGDTYSIFEPVQVVKHPQTRQAIGTLMNNLGYVQVTEITGDTVVARIGEIYREVTRGAELFAYSPAVRDVVLKRGTATRMGHLIASRDEKGTFSTNDVVYIDLGSADGVESGNLLYVSRPRTVSDEIVKKAGHVTLPDQVLGAAVVVEARPNSASAVFIKSVTEAFIGDQVSVVTD